MSDVVDWAIESVGGEVLVRHSERGVMTSYGLRNTVLDELVNKLERTGLATTTEDALLSMVPLFGKLPKNSTSTKEFSDLANEISAYTEGGQFEQAESLLLWLFDTAESEVEILEGENKWKEAGETYLLLLTTYDRLGNEDYISNTEEAMGLFCERFLRYKKTLPESEGALQEPLELLRTEFCSEEEPSGVLTMRLQYWAENRGGWSDKTNSIQQLSDKVEEER
ncbi:hypothetical protein BDD12DRAFT_557043 [Trichophaea hybrida]|nr:hypothetical protein BDD12DRAFT_557043 [Trichophaea hybrida]